MKKQNDMFTILLFIARPAAGKSEIIDYLKHANPGERKARFHIGEFDVIDDFPMLWTWFEEDRILEQMGHPRLHSNREGLFLHNYFWHVLIRRICLEYEKKIRHNPDYHQQKTTILEFSRGKPSGGYAAAFEHLSKSVLERLAIVYVNVSWEESLRKNRSRYNPQRADSILEHGLPDEKMKKMYRDDDWHEIIQGHNEYLPLQGIKVPYVIFENEDDVTTDRGEALGERLEKTLAVLWERWQAKS